MSQSGEGADGGTVDECDAYMDAQAGRVDRSARKSIEVEGHAMWKAGKLDAAAEHTLRRRLAEACGGQAAEVEISWLTITSPTGRYGDNPKVIAAFE